MATTVETKPTEVTEGVETPALSDVGAALGAQLQQTVDAAGKVIYTGIDVLDKSVEASPGIAAMGPQGAVAYGLFKLDFVDNALKANTFLDNLGYKDQNPLERAGTVFEIGALGAIGNTEKLRGMIGAKEPGDLFNALKSVDPDSADFLDALSAKPELAKSIHNAVVNDPTALAGLQAMAADKDGGIDAEKLEKALADPSVSASFTGLFNAIAAKSDDEIQFNTLTGVMTKLGKGDIEGANLDLKDAGAPEIAVSGGLLGNFMTPDGVLDMIADKAGLKLSDKITQDEAFKEALFDAVVKDPSVLQGMLLPPKDGEEPFDLKELATSLEDPNTRRTMTEVLAKVAEDPNDEFDFKYLSDIGKASKEKDYKKLKELLDKAGIEDDRVTYAADPMKAFNDFINDPVGFAEKFPAMLGMEGQQAEALKELLMGASSLLEMFIGGETGYRAFAQHYGPIAGEWGMDMFDRLSGEADRKFEMGKTATLIDKNDMAPLKFEDLEKMVFQANANENGLGSKVSSENDADKGKLNEGFAPAASGIVNVAQSPAWAQSFYDNQANNNANKGLVVNGP